MNLNPNEFLEIENCTVLDMSDKTNSIFDKGTIFIIPKSSIRKIHKSLYAIVITTFDGITISKKLD